MIKPLVLAGLVLGAAGGCEWIRLGGPVSSSVQVEVPKPIDLLLPREIRIHEFTGTRVFHEDGGISGIDVRLEAIDAYGDSNKAFGEFRFELFHFDAAGADHKGARIAVWKENIEDPKDNRRHWNGITRTYQFKLLWDEPIPVGQRFVLTVVFQSPFSPLRFDKREFVSGQ